MNLLLNIKTMIVGTAYVAAVIIHLVACFFKFKKIQKTSKWFLMPLLALFYFVTAASPSPIIVIALICGWLGDIMQLPLPGAIPFGIGHILYCIIMITLIDFSTLKFFHILIPIIFFVVVMAFVYKHLRPHIAKTSLRIVVIGYMALISVMGISAILLLISSFTSNTLAPANILMVIGGILFVVSDSILSEVLFIPDTDTRDFPVMLTYISAQTLITLGFVFLNN